MDRSTKKMPSLDFIAGIVSSFGSFFWSHKNGRRNPIFQLKIHASDKALLVLVKVGLCLKENIYEYNHQNRHYAVLMVRKRLALETQVIPLLNSRLFGRKSTEFELWRDMIIDDKLKRIGVNPMVES